jgi:hypothetical protein
VKIPKLSEADEEWFRSLVPEAPGVEVKPMFGNLGAFVNGIMVIGLFGPDVGVRLAPENRTRLLTEAGTGPFGPPPRPMKKCVSLPADWRDQPEKAAEWVDLAPDHGSAMLPKRKG